MAPDDADAEPRSTSTPPVPLTTIAREWGRIGTIGFGGPPAHISLLRELCVVDRGWISDEDFEHAIAATNLLPGPASTQLAIFCAWRLRRTLGGLVGGFMFIVPGLVFILLLSVLFLRSHPPHWVSGIAAGFGAAVPAVALQAAAGLVPGSWRGLSASENGPRVRWVLYVVAGGAAAATIGPFLVVVLLGCGLIELIVRSWPSAAPTERTSMLLPFLLPAVMMVGGLGAVAWVAFKVGALSFGGGFVIVPLMQADAVHHYHWMTGGQFLNAVALGQITPGPVVQTVSAVGYAAGGIGAALLAAVVAFAPSFAFILAGARQFERLRTNVRAQSFLRGSGPAAIGAIAGSAIPLGLALSHVWQVGVLGLAAVWLLALRRGVVSALLAAGFLGLLAAFAGLPVLA
ncbi:MAG TPA: chromate efflux transporter [Acidimicrobiales bacterium]|nr:chromate efflux transporter [Acidimicrobiales bacterium]